MEKRLYKHHGGSYHPHAEAERLKTQHKKGWRSEAGGSAYEAVN